MNVDCALSPTKKIFFSSSLFFDCLHNVIEEVEKMINF